MPLALWAFYFSVAVFAQDWFASRFDYVQLGHVVPLRLLSLVATLAISHFFVPRLPILCARAWVLYSCKLGPIIDNCRAHCHYGHLNCLAQNQHRHGACRCCIGFFTIRTMVYMYNIVAGITFIGCGNHISHPCPIQRRAHRRHGNIFWQRYLMGACFIFFIGCYATCHHNSWCQKYSLHVYLGGCFLVYPCDC